MTNTIGGAPGHLTNSQAGRTFTGFVKHHNQLPRMQQLTMREIGGREVVVRVEAAQGCYTSVEAILRDNRPGTGGGTNDRRDTPKFVRLMEAGQLDMKTLDARSCPLDDVVEAYQVCGDREVIATVVTPNS